jgi:hypothetical protein
MSVHNSEHSPPPSIHEDDDDGVEHVTLISKLDLSHPLHLHPIVTPKTLNLFIKLSFEVIVKNHKIFKHFSLIF